MLKKAPAALLLTAALLPACATTPPEELKLVEIDRAFQLPVGGAAQLRSTDLRLGIEAVLSDSRCPKGVQCVWAGDAVLRVWLQRGTAGRQGVDLSLSAAEGTLVQGQRLRLIKLEPAPVAGKTFVQADYQATLLMQPSSASPSQSAADR